MPCYAYYYMLVVSFFFNDTATTEIYTLSLHDALPICARKLNLSSRYCRTVSDTKMQNGRASPISSSASCSFCRARSCGGDRKSTRLNSSHVEISYAVFCLKKKTIEQRQSTPSRKVHRR